MGQSAGPRNPGFLISGNLRRSGFPSAPENFLIRFDKRVPNLRRKREKCWVTSPWVSSLRKRSPPALRLRPRKFLIRSRKRVSNLRWDRAKHYTTLPGVSNSVNLRRSGFSSAPQKLLIRFHERVPNLKSVRAKHWTALPRNSNLRYHSSLRLRPRPRKNFNTIRQKGA